MTTQPHRITVVAAVLAGLAAGAARSRAGEDPAAVFRQPPESARPGVWWHWMGANVSAEGITRDLEEFAAAGIGSATIFGMADVCTPWAGHIENSPNEGLLAFTDPWWKLVRHAAAEGRRLGVDVGLHNCPGYTSTGGPWITPELAMQQIFQSRTIVEGGATFRSTLPKPEIDPRGDMLFPMINKQTGKLEKPVIEARRTYWRDVAVLAVPAEGVIAKEQVVDLTGKAGADGRLEWTPPAGKWALYRFGHTVMGALTQPNQWEVMGLECDKMNEQAVAFHLGHVLGKLREHLGPLVGTGLRHVLLDSYEAGKPSWTPRMPEEFERRRGYALKPFLPVFAGRVVGSEAETAKFRADFDRTIADLYRDVLFTTMSRMLGEAGLRFTCEPYGGPFHTGEVAPHVQRVMTEFWTGDSFRGGPQAGIFNAGDGKLHNILEAEAFTGSPAHSQWTETPAWLKPVGDGAFCAGINRLVLHSNPHQPWRDDVRPGMTMGQWGTHFGRTQTWWEPGKAWLAYLARCQALLQWGARAPAGGFSIAANEGDPQVQGIHRTDGARHVFFLANLGVGSGTALCTFRAGAAAPELWDPVTGAQRALTDWRADGGRTRLLLEFAPGQSCFVVFRGGGAKPEPTVRNCPATREAGNVAGPWQVAFDPAWGGPREPVEFRSLDDWTARPEPGIRYFSGTAAYRTTFNLTNIPEGDSFLDLGTVRHLARVSVNGRDLGVVWCVPWRVTVPAGLLQASGNRLEIAVTNVWANRLIGDEQEPEDCEWLPGHMGGRYLKRVPDWFVEGRKRPSAGRRTFTTWNYFNRDSRPVSSGLLGPVRVLAAEWRQERSAVPDTLPAEPLVAPGSADAFEADLPPAARLVPVARWEEGGAIHSGGGGTDAGPLHNGTTRNGSGGAATLDDGRTFRGYGNGNSLLLRLDLTDKPAGHRVAEVRAFAGHGDGRASQEFSVAVAKAGSPDRFVKVAEAGVTSAGGATQLRVPVAAAGVAAVRLDFADGPLGFNVYREICLVGANGETR